MEFSSFVENWRTQGRELCATDGSDHYRTSLQALDYIASQGHLESFCIGNIIKYASRWKSTQNLNDLKKIADYAHILAGYSSN